MIFSKKMITLTLCSVLTLGIVGAYAIDRTLAVPDQDRIQYEKLQDTYEQKKAELDRLPKNTDNPETINKINKKVQELKKLDASMAKLKKNNPDKELEESLLATKAAIHDKIIEYRSMTKDPQDGKVYQEALEKALDKKAKIEKIEDDYKNNTKSAKELNEELEKIVNEKTLDKNKLKNVADLEDLKR